MKRADEDGGIPYREIRYWVGEALALAATAGLTHQISGLRQLFGPAIVPPIEDEGAAF